MLMSAQAMKRTLRQSIIAGRAALDADARERWGADITARLLALPAYREARTVLGFMSFGAEFASDAWVQAALGDGKAVWLPRVDRERKVLDLFRVRDVAQDVAPGMWDIREPDPARCERVMAMESLDLVLLPGVAFSRCGERLGYGGGFYDKLLASFTHEPLLVAAAYAMQVVEEIPQEPTDRKVHWLVTQDETIDCRQ